MATLVGRQHHVARRHSRAAQDTNGTVEVDASLAEQRLELLRGEKVARLGEEGGEWHADGARDVTRFCVCRCQRENITVLISNCLVFCSKLMRVFFFNRSGALVGRLPA